MWKKTCIKQLSKTISKTEKLQKALAEDNKESTIEAARIERDLAGPAVGKALHAPDATPVHDTEGIDPIAPDEPIIEA